MVRVMTTEPEVLFIGDCQICGERDVSCRNHHIVPRRLLAILPKSRARRWEHQKIRICNRCNNYIHPENKLYLKILVLEQKLGYKMTDAELQIFKKEFSKDSESKELPEG
jgi:hypothetical protein